MPLKDLAGQKFGNLTVIRRAKNHVTKHGKTLVKWLCKCDCGVEKEIMRSNLTHKTHPVRSCGCIFKNSMKYNAIDLTNVIFGDLKVIRKSSKCTKTRGCLWECECKCGKIVTLATNSLTSGNNRTCGDKNKHTRMIFTAGEVSLKQFNRIKQNAIKRNLECNITPEYIWALYQEQNGKCKISGVQLNFKKECTASLDRIDSTKGYIIGNVQWVHKVVNIMKNSMLLPELVSWCNNIYINNIGHRVDQFSNNKWDYRFLQLAQFISTWSKDPSTKCGAVIVDDKKHIVSIGFNGFANGVDDNVDLYNNRDTKLKMVIHCEVNAVLFAERNDLRGCTLYTYPLGSCSNCASVMIQKGIRRFVYPPLPEHLRERWADSLALAAQQFKDVGAQCIELEVRDG